MATILGDNVLDDLLDVVDDLRGDLHDNFGTREYRVQAIIRTYTGNRQDGYYAEVTTELSPPPKIDFIRDEFEMNGAGKLSKDQIRITQLSLNFSKDQLLPVVGMQNVKVYFRLIDNHGENMPDRIFHLKGLPSIDRKKTVGWICYAIEIQDKDWNINGPR